MVLGFSNYVLFLLLTNETLNSNYRDTYFALPQALLFNLLFILVCCFLYCLDNIFRYSINWVQSVMC